MQPLQGARQRERISCGTKAKVEQVAKMPVSDRPARIITAYVARRTADGRTKREIIRCLKRFLAREIYQRVMTDFRARQDRLPTAQVVS